MKINITYPIDISDIPEEMSKKILKLYEDLNSHTFYLKGISNKLLTEKVSSILKEIDEWRTKLAELDHQLQVYSIILADSETQTNILYREKMNSQEEKQLDESKEETIIKQ